MAAPLVTMMLPDFIEVPEHRKRALQPAKVQMLADSIARIGQQFPVSVLPKDGGGYVLISGLHRLEACRILDTGVLALPFRTAADAELWEISENLHRAELTPDERDEHIRAWAALSKKLSASNDALRKPGAGPGAKGGARQIAREIGVSEPTVRRALKGGKAVDENPIVDTTEPVVEPAKEWDPVAPERALIASFGPHVHEHFLALKDAWHNACRAAQRVFEGYLNGAHDPWECVAEYDAENEEVNHD